ncbi:MAG: hypothetical protein DRR19_33315 [Candidatus Parabeggiatoa sp. nov. 1]|nr:MAG: hypothetical protein DRR19_33315 [Gammaproteobacteria bacterium]
MNFQKYQHAFLAMPLLLGVATSAPAQEVNVNLTVDNLITPAATRSRCNLWFNSDLRFVVNDRVMHEDVVLDSQWLFNVGEFLKVELVEDLRVCTRHDRVDLWVALEMPGDIRIYMVSSPFPPFMAFVPDPAPFKSDLDGEQVLHSVLNFEVVPGVPTGDYRFYAAYAETGTDISELLFTLRSNRAMAKVTLSGR